MEQKIKDIAWADIKNAEYISPVVLLKMVKTVLAEEIGAVYRFERDGLKISFINGQKFRLQIEEV